MYFSMCPALHLSGLATGRGCIRAGASAPYKLKSDRLSSTGEKVDASAVGEHVAVQWNIVGEGEGALYVEVADGNVNVEGYEYFDKDATFYATADEFVKIASFKADIVKEIAEDRVSVSGNYDKAILLAKIVKKTAARKPAAKKAETAEAPAKKAPAKKAAAEAPAKKTTAKKTTKKTEA